MSKLESSIELDMIELALVVDNLAEYKLVVEVGKLDRDHSYRRVVDKTVGVGNTAAAVGKLAVAVDRLAEVVDRLAEVVE